MPHQFMTIDCKECGKVYCVVCHDGCPECESKPALDKETLKMRDGMRRHMSGPHEGH